MNHFYRVTITKQLLGSAIEHKEPSLQGQIQAKVTDSTTQGNFKIIVVNCDDDQHQLNLSSSAIQNLEENEVTELAPLYQPERTIKRFDPKNHKSKQVVILAADLSRFYFNLPSYEDYIIKSQVSEANTLFAGFKTEIMNIYSDRGSFPKSLSELEEAGVITSGSYVAGFSYHLEGGYPVVQAIFSKDAAPEIANKRIKWIYQGQGEWSCRNSQTNEIPERFLPKACRQSIIDASTTPLPLT